MRNSKFIPLNWVLILAENWNLFTLCQNLEYLLFNFSSLMEKSVNIPVNIVDEFSDGKKVYKNTLSQFTKTRKNTNVNTVITLPTFL